MYWTYFTLVNGRLLDEDDQDANPNWPSFKDACEAENFLVDHDIRGSVR